MRNSTSLVKNLTQLLQAAAEQRGNGGPAATELISDVGHRPALEVAQQQGLRMGVGQAGEGLVGPRSICSLCWACSLGEDCWAASQPSSAQEESARRASSERSRAASRHSRPKLADGVGQGVGEYLPQPGGLLGSSLSAQLVEFLVRLEKRLLNDVRGVEFAAQVRRQVQPGRRARSSR